MKFSLFSFFFCIWNRIWYVIIDFCVIFIITCLFLYSLKYFTCDWWALWWDTICFNFAFLVVSSGWISLTQFRQFLFLCKRVFQTLIFTEPTFCFVLLPFQDYFLVPFDFFDFTFLFWLFLCVRGNGKW